MLSFDMHSEFLRTHSFANLRGRSRNSGKGVHIYEGVCGGGDGGWGRGFALLLLPRLP